MTEVSHLDEQRVLVMAPVGADSELAERVLRQAGIACRVCSSVDDLCSEMQRGAGAILMTEEVLWHRKLDSLVAVLDVQPSWSALPIVIAAEMGRSLYERSPVLRRLERFKVTFLARPVVTVSLVSMLRSALAARARQYQVRDLMENLQKEVSARDAFLATLSHELRNPVSAVRNAIQLMELSTENPDIHASCREVIDRQSRDLTRLLDDLLDVARVTQGKITLQRSRVGLRQLLTELAKDLRDTLSCKLSLTLPEEELLVSCDRLRIKQVFLNLVDNADKFSEVGSTVTVAAQTDGAWASVSVKDEGIGIASDKLDGIFQLFAQASQPSQPSRGGLGIGLTVVQSLVRMNGGTISAHSEGCGKGTEFVVRLPLAPSDEARPSGHRAAGRRHTKPKRLLLIEDDPDGASMLKALLETDRHEVTVCADGQSGLSQARMDPDAIIIDIGLPDCSGYDVARTLREQPAFSDTLLIALTGYGSERDRQRARESGFDHHLTKPIDFTTLRAVLGRGRSAEGQDQASHSSGP